MIQFISDNKEFLSLCFSGLGVLLSLAFGGILSWKHKICLEYESRRDVAITILRDRFVQRTSKHYSDIADELEAKEISVDDIYGRPEQQRLIQELGKDLEDKNRVRLLHRGLVLASQVSFGFLWFSILLIFVSLGILWFIPPRAVWIAWGTILGLLVLGFFCSISVMHLLDGRFFRLVHRIIEPEGE